uniref:ATP synthase YMF19-like N-terminal domain-containing protein n=1 Tax=Zelkova schneideriana TaxID=172643 RepID=A0A8F1N7B6_9ROSA|nr:hypothetical protein [Zelkova schneideriana]
MPQLDKFTYFTQFFWLCWFVWFGRRLYLPSHIEARIYFFYMRRKWLHTLFIFSKFLVFGVFLLHAYSLFEHSVQLWFGVLPNPNPIIQLPAQEVQQDALWDDLDAREQEAAAREEARRLAEEAKIEAEVESIMEKCAKVHKNIIGKTHAILKKSGYIIDDPDDVKRVVDVVMVEHEEIDPDHRINHYLNLQNYLGNTKYKFWREILELLGEYGIRMPSDSDEE